MECAGARSRALKPKPKKPTPPKTPGSTAWPTSANSSAWRPSLTCRTPRERFDDYLQQVTLISDVDKIKDGGGAVTLMTLHAAKGLEFPFVAMVGMEDGLIPHARAVGFAANPDEMEEERRLAFVGITRAMKQLVLSNARYRMIRGQTERTIASQFLAEMPEECFEEIDLTRDEDGAGSVGYRDEASYGRRERSRRGPAPRVASATTGPSRPTSSAAPPTPSPGNSVGGFWSATRNSAWGGSRTSRRRAR